MPIKKIKKETTTLRINKSLAEKIKAIAQKEGRKIEVISDKIIETGIKNYVAG